MGRDTKQLEALFLTRRGVLYPPDASGLSSEELVRAVELELAQLGYVISHGLQARLRALAPDALAGVRVGVIATLAQHTGREQATPPLFRSFPHGIPDDTAELWWRKVLAHFHQAPDQPCLFCGEVGTTHVLDPCKHVVCDRCFDGSSYSACPVCEHHVNRDSPFFRESAPRDAPKERVKFKLLTPGHSLEADAHGYFAQLCRRTQALSPDDREALALIASTFSDLVLDWLPEAIPVRENAALVIGTLLKGGAPEVILKQTSRFLQTATDVLRALAVMSGEDGSLLPTTRIQDVEIDNPPPRHVSRVEALRRANPSLPQRFGVPEQVRRFKLAKLPRALRRALLGYLERFPEQALTEDMLRHRSYWVWVGEFLHPHEYAKRFPKVARAFQVVRKRAPDGARPPRFRTWYSQVEHALESGDATSLLSIVAERPGEFARRLDLLLRSAPNPAHQRRVSEAFRERVPQLATPMLLTLRSHLAHRSAPARVRVYWPKGKTTTGHLAKDERKVLPHALIQALVRDLDQELLRRFGAHEHFEVCVLDRALQGIVVPFNERTASPSAVSLPRGSQLSTPTGKQLRLFLHWCQPEEGAHQTDLDLSVGFYDAAWQHIGVCSYYQLSAKAGDQTLAVSAGDLRNAPFPDGATEYVDVYLDAARKAGVRYAVAVVNAYAGMTFGELERAFAGLMFREDIDGEIFDPRSVELKFALQGEHGIYLPLALDLETQRMHWLDVHSKGTFTMNNVASSNRAITHIVPAFIDYFGSGTRPNVFELGLLHAAARCERVFIRDGSSWCEHRRSDGESDVDFLGRLRGEGAKVSEPPLASPVLALLHAGDLVLPDGSACYALFRAQSAVTLAASDLVT